MWLRYSSSALIVGGSTVGLTFLLAGTIVQKEVYVVLQSLYAFLVIISALLMRLASPKPYRSGALQDNLVYTIAGAVYIIFIVSSSIKVEGWPVKPYASAWWQLFAVALVAAFLGAVKRMYAENKLEKLAKLKKDLETLADLQKIAYHRRPRQLATRTRQRRPGSAITSRGGARVARRMR
jgi:hypothetical protein